MKNIKVLAIDDDAINLDILREYCQNSCYITAIEDPNEAWRLLQEGIEVDVILLDRMMPKMDGLLLLQMIKRDPKLYNIPVIMQTSASSQAQIHEGIQSGVFYYLTKPYSQDVLLSLIKAAFHERSAKKKIGELLNEYTGALVGLHEATFHFSTVDEARSLATLIGSSLHNPNTAISALAELLINAIEHGNYNIGYEQKKIWKQQNIWEEKLQALQNTYTKPAVLKLAKQGKTFVITIADNGAGFDYRKYIEPNISNLTDPNGRGILMAINANFVCVEYLFSGNVVKIIANIL